MNNDEFNATNNTNQDPWELLRQDVDSIVVLDNGKSDKIAFYLLIILGACTILACLVVTCRQAKRRSTCIPTSFGQFMSCLCVLVFFGLLAAGFLTLGVFVNEKEWIDNYSSHGQVRILDTRVVPNNMSVWNATLNKTSFTTTSEYQAQVRVTFGGEWACGTTMNDTFCNGFVIIPECSTSVCNDDAEIGSNCSNSDENRIKEAQENATTCLANLTGNYEMPIDNTTFDPTISPESDPNYPNFPLIDGYWNCDTCTFITVADYEIHEPSDSLKMTGILLIVGAALVCLLWILVRIIKWICCPQVTFDPVGSNADWQYADDWTNMPTTRSPRRKLNDARRWVRSKQWFAGSPIPDAYSPHDFEQEIEMQQRDGLEKIDDDGVNGNGVHEKELPPEEEDDDDEEVPDYWREWNESQSSCSEPS